MTTTTHVQTPRGALAGLVYGDGHSYAALWHRIPLQPGRKRLFAHKASTWVHELDHTTQTHPHRHSAPADIWQPTGPTDGTEWVYVTLLAALGRGLDGGAGQSVWSELVRLRNENPGSVRGRSGTIYALNNLRRGLTAPASGNDHAHYFDDHSVVRGAALGLLHPGDPRAAADTAGEVLAVTHSEDGIWCGRAAAALTAAGLRGAQGQELRDLAVDYLPAPSWSSATVAEMLECADASSGPADLADRLESEHVDDIYTFNVSAPETLGVLLAHLTTSETVESFLSGVQAHPRGNSGIMPAAGMLASVFYGTEWLPDRLKSRLPHLEGSSITALQGRSLEALADLLPTESASPAASAG